MQCPYGCNTEIEKIELKIDPSRTLKEGEFVNDDTGPGRIIELYYEKNSDGDLEYIHICKEFQKILDYQDQRTGLDIIRNKIFEKNYDADFNATELDPQIINEIFGSSIKQNERVCKPSPNIVIGSLLRAFCIANGINFSGNCHGP